MLSKWISEWRFTFILTVSLSLLAIFFTRFDVMADTIILLSNAHSVNAVPLNSPVHALLKEELVQKLQRSNYKVLIDDEIIKSINPNEFEGRALDKHIFNTMEEAGLKRTNFALMYSLFIRTEDYGGGRKINGKMTGRLFDIMNRTRIGVYEVTFPKDMLIPSDCYQDCLLNAASEYVRDMVDALVRDSIIKLQELSTHPKSLNYENKKNVDNAGSNQQSENFKLLIDGYTSDELNLIIRFIPSFKGYLSSKFMTESPTGKVLLVRISNNREIFIQNLRLLMKHLSLPSIIDPRGQDIILIRGS